MTDAGRADPVAPPAAPRSKGVRLVLLRAVAVVAMLGLLGWGIAVTAVELGQRSRPSLPLLAAAVVITGAATASGGLGWAALFGVGHRLILTRGYVASQLAKYLPGGIWQPAGQVVMARAAGVGTAEAGTAMLLFYGVAVVVASLGGPVLAIGLGDLPPLVRAGAAVLPLSVLGLHPAMLRRVLRLVPWGRRSGPLVIPPPARLVRAAAGHAGYLAGHGLALAVVLSWLGIDHAPVVVVAAYAVSWGAGFLAVPVPAGAGVREALLVALLAPYASAQQVVAAAVVVRLAGLVSEVLLAGALVGVERLARPADPVAVPGRPPVGAQLVPEQVER